MVRHQAGPPAPEDDDKTPTQPQAELAAALRQTRRVDTTESMLTQARRPCLVVLAGPRVGEVIAISGALTIGREPRAGLHLLDEGVSRRHCTVELSEQGVRLCDLDSTNGTWVNGQRVRNHLLLDGDRFRVGQTTVIKFALQDAIEEQYQRQLFETALRDPLTRAFNRRYFRERLEAEAAYAERHQAQLALLFANVDRFEHVNRLVGREGADDLLRTLAEILHGAIRTDDVLARIGEDTFAVIARETSLDGAVRLAERLRGVVADARFTVGVQGVELRVSIGVAAAVPGGEQGVEALSAAAQAALGRSKQGGRNRVSVDDGSAAPRTNPWSATEQIPR